MSRKFIPIIGTISAGKSTFLNALLGIDSLQTGALTTTKFVCLIQNSPNISFYHVIPKRINGVVLEKEGQTINDIAKIIEKIQQINQELEKKIATINDLFYKLEIPIKNIKNETLLESCYFMDIPGLNEYKASYIDIIFSIILKEDILFEIIVFDAKAIHQQSSLDIFEKLEKKKVLKKEKNIYILNKIDQFTKGEDPKEVFKEQFYKTYEDEKNESKITINFNDNEFIALNSILYQAETKYNTDFYSALLIELFAFLEENNSTTLRSFSDFLKERIECIIAQNNISIDIIKSELKKIEKADKIIILESVNKLEKNSNIFNKNKDTNIQLNLNDKNDQETLLQLYIIHKKKLNENFIFSPSYYKIESAFDNYYKELPCPPPILHKKKEDITKKKSDELIYELQEFIEKHLKNTFKTLNRSLKYIIENLVEQKIRISFIGNISVGKSTVLNCIIGYDLLPSSDKECTYRGIIIKYKDINNPQLYRAHLEIICKGTGSDYYKFSETGLYCEGIEPIKSYLTNKNKDKDFNDKDAFIIIYAKLKIFDFIKLSPKYLDKIEFVDLPGYNRSENKFVNKVGNESSPLDKILKFTDCCIFINQYNSIQSEDNVKAFKDIYRNNKQKLDPTIQNKSIETSIFLFNKVDELNKEKKEEEKIKLKKQLLDIIYEVEKNIPSNWDNISYFSGKQFQIYLGVLSDFMDIIDKAPIELLENYYKKLPRLFLFKKSFYNYVIEDVKNKTSSLDLNVDNGKNKNNFNSFLNGDDNDNKDITVPKDFYNKMKLAFNEFKKRHKNVIDDKEEEEDIIKKIYQLYFQIKSKDFDNTDFSHHFFLKLKEVIINSAKIQKEIIKIEMNNFFQNTDKLFSRNIDQEKASKKKEKDEKRQEYEMFKYKVIPEIGATLENKEKIIKENIEITRKGIIKLIEDEIDNAEERLKDAEGDPAKASSILEEKIKVEYNKMVSFQSEEIKVLFDEIVKISNKVIETHYQEADLSESEINVMKQKSFGLIQTLLTGAVGGATAGVGLAAIGSSVMASVAAGTMSATAMTTLVGSFFGPLGIVAGVAVGGAITGITLLIKKLMKTKKYKNSLENTKNNLIRQFDDIDSNFTFNFEKFKNKLIKELNTQNETELESIEHMSLPDWDKMTEEYQLRKKEIEMKLNEEIQILE